MCCTLELKIPTIYPLYKDSGIIPKIWTSSSVSSRGFNWTIQARLQKRENRMGYYGYTFDLNLSCSEDCSTPFKEKWSCLANVCVKILDKVKRTEPYTETVSRTFTPNESKAVITRFRSFQPSVYNTYEDQITVTVEVSVTEVELDGILSNARLGDLLCQSAVRDFRILLDSGKNADLLIQSKEGSEFRVHRAFLIAKSPVFSAMFETDMREKNEGKLLLLDMSTKAVELFIRFLYYGDILKDINALGRSREANLVLNELLSAAEKYDIPDLKKCCAHALQVRCSTENAKDIYSIVRKYSCEMEDAEGIKDFIKIYVRQDEDEEE